MVDYICIKLTILIPTKCTFIVKLIKYKIRKSFHNYIISSLNGIVFFFLGS